MKRLVIAMSALLMIVACDKEDKNTMIVEGNIEGLKMGTIYLQQYVNDKLTNIDSVVANGDGKFTFKRHLESPEVFYIYLDLKKQAGTDLGDRLMFFGEPTTININSAYDMFEVRANISGSQSQKEYNEYLHTMRQFGMRNAQLLEQQVNAFKAGKTPVIRCRAMSRSSHSSRSSSRRTRSSGPDARRITTVSAGCAVVTSSSDRIGARSVPAPISTRPFRVREASVKAP